MSIAVQNISHFYGSQKALNQISFNIQEGHVTGLLGPNGAGKSTLMKILTGYLAPTSGTALINGYSITGQSQEARRHIGYLPEHNPLYLDLYVREYLELMGKLQGLGTKALRRADEVIELTEITPERHKLIGQLSKGYRQRVGLAQALLHQPQVLILDEPTSGLDPNQIVGIRNLIRSLGRECTVLLSTHIMQEVEAICNRVIIIDGGNIVLNDDMKHLDGQSLEAKFRELTTFK
jgi:ABC-2 type transport system ATP-binding protein